MVLQPTCVTSSENEFAEFQSCADSKDSRADTMPPVQTPAPKLFAIPPLEGLAQAHLARTGAVGDALQTLRSGQSLV